MRRTPKAKAQKPALTSAIVVLVLALASACGGDQPVAQPPTGPDAVELVVEQVTEGPTVYIEGSRSCVAIKRPDDETVVQRRLPEEERPSVRIALDPGEYMLLSWQRICDGDCSKLSGPRDECERAFDADPSTSLRATIHVRPSFGCEITIEN